MNINNHTVAPSYVEIGSTEWCCCCDTLGFKRAGDKTFYENWLLYVASVDLEITPVFKWNPRKLAGFKKSPTVWFQRGGISGVPVKWQDVETPTQNWDLLTKHRGSRNWNDRQCKEESDRRDWEEERSDGTVVNPPTQHWDPTEYIKWNGGRFGSKGNRLTFCFPSSQSRGYRFPSLQKDRLFINIWYQQPKISFFSKSVCNIPPCLNMKEAVSGIKYRLQCSRNVAVCTFYQSKSWKMYLQETNKNEKEKEWSKRMQRRPRNCSWQIDHIFIRPTFFKRNNNEFQSLCTLFFLFIKCFLQAIFVMIFITTQGVKYYICPLCRSNCNNSHNAVI